MVQHGRGGGDEEQPLLRITMERAIDDAAHIKDQQQQQTNTCSFVAPLIVVYINWRVK